MDPCCVWSTAPLVYSNFSPGRRTGWFPTTPSPFTSSRLPLPSVMIQWRLRSWAAMDPMFSIRTVYANAQRPVPDCSGRYRLFTVMRIPWVTAVDTAQSCQYRSVRATGTREEVHHEVRIREASRGVPPAALPGAAARHARGDGGGRARRSQRELRVQAGKEEAPRDRREDPPPPEAARVLRGGGPRHPPPDRPGLFRRHRDGCG